MIRRLLVAALALGCAGPAAGNDSTASVAAGGLILSKSDSIAMLSEDLFVSVDEVRVKYRFRNLTLRPVTTVVAFPMPPRKLYDEFGGDVAYPSDFRTMVDGRLVAVTRERKAMAKGKDQTALLKALKIPVAPDRLLEATRRMDSLSPVDKKRLVDLGLAFEEEYDDTGAGMRTHLVAKWTVVDNYWWRQTFPAGRDLMIDHRYVPGAGGSVETGFAFPEFRQSSDSLAMIKRYCVDKDFIAAVDARRNKGPEGPMMPDRTIDYILTTGGNWAKPIGDFRLVVDKGNARNLVSFCGTGIRKISPTRFEMRKRNWRPDQNLHVLIIEPRR